MESVSIKALGTRVQISGASLINYQTTLVLFGTRNKHLSDKLDHVQHNTSRLIEGNDTAFENRHKTLNFPLHIYAKITSVLLQLFKFIKSDFAANLEDYTEPSLQALKARLSN